jgi:hypothetical protein
MIDHLVKNEYRLDWGPGRHDGTRHSLFTYHKDPDGNVIELFTQIDRMSDGSKGYWGPPAPSGPISPGVAQQRPACRKPPIPGFCGVSTGGRSHFSRYPTAHGT